MTKLALLFILFVWIPSTACSQTTSDTIAVKKTLESWNQGWAKKDADLAIQDYADVHLRLDTASNPSGTVVGYLRRGDDETLKITVLPAASDIRPHYKPVAGFVIHKVKEMKLFAK